MPHDRLLLALVVVCATTAGCSSSDDAVTSAPTAPVATTIAPDTIAPDTTADTVADTAPATEAPAPTDSAVPSTVDTVAAPEPNDDETAYRDVVSMLADDALGGRDNGSDGSLMAQDELVALLQDFADPVVADATGSLGYRQVFDNGTNLLAVIPGSDLADQYVIVGAHYDHLGSDCDGVTADDSICNGATDNATGVAAAIAIGRSIASDPTPPRRSVIIALWDREEDGLLGSAAYLADPVAPLDATVGYVNFDIQGTNISPALRDVTVMVGAETGGAPLVDAAQRAATASTLDTVALSLLFGQGRSDHANFVIAGVPSVFFTDATPPCYHTVDDEVSIVDFPKLVQQEATAEALTRDLMNTDDVPVLDAAAPPAAYADAVAMLHIGSKAAADFGRFSDADRTAAEQFIVDLNTIVDGGPEAFDDAAVGVLLAGSITLVNAWESGECDGFLDA
jgi:hypothetical protein